MSTYKLGVGGNHDLGPPFARAGGFLSFRHLVFALIRMQFQIRYRQSFAGFAWAILPPLGALGAATIVFHQIAGVGEGIESYTLVVMSALVPWTFFANSLTLGIPILAHAQGMLTRLSFPRVALPVGAIGICLIDLGVAAVIYVAFAYVLGVGLPGTVGWLLLPLGIELMFVLGIVLLGSALNVFARDVRLAVPLGIQLWLILTPVMYPLAEVPDGLRGWYLANPMTGVVESFREILTTGAGPQMEHLLPAAVGSFAFLAIGSWYFAATHKRFADVI